jgi:hypothetical protein
MMENNAPVTLNGVIHALVKMNPDARAPHIDLRGLKSHGVNGEWQDQGYAFGLEPTRKVMQLQVFTAKGHTILQEWPYPRDYRADEWVRIELRVVGDELTASFDGWKLNTVRDSVLTLPGKARVYAKQAGLFRDIVFTPLDKPRDTQPPLVAGAAGRVVDLLPLVDLQRHVNAGTWSRTPDGVSVQLSDGASVLELPYRPPDEYDFEIEITPHGPGANVNQYLCASGHSFAWKLNAHQATPPLYGFEMLDGKACKDFFEAATHTNTAIESGHRYRSRIEVRRGGLRALLDGTELVQWSGDFSRFSMENITRLRDQQHLGIGSWKRAVTFHKITVRELTGAGNLDAGVNVSPADSTVPSIPHWQDLTEEVREKARTFSNLVVEPDSVRHSGSGNQVVIPLTRHGVQDYAIRLRFTSDGQIGLRSSPDAFIYVLCQRNQTIFHHYEVATGAPTLLRPNVPHPADFDSRPTHEMLVTMKGSTVSVWLDGRFVGEAHDTQCKSGDAKLVFTKSTVVHKVEVAELAAAAVDQ